MARVINVSSAKGGVGKTTVAINLGVALAKYFGKKVALVDCNFTASHVGLYLGMYNTPVTLNSVMRDESRINKALYTHSSGLVIMPASMSLRDLHDLTDESLTHTIRRLSDSFDIILLDSAPGVGREALMSLKACDEVLFVANPFIPSVTDVARVADLCSSSEDLRNIKQLWIVMNKVENKDYELSPDETKALTNMSIVGVVPEDKNILKAVSTKTSVVLSNPNSKTSRAFLRLAAELIGEEYREQTLLNRFGDGWDLLRERFNINTQKFLNNLALKKKYPKLKKNVRKKLKKMKKKLKPKRKKPE